MTEQWSRFRNDLEQRAREYAQAVRSGRLPGRVRLVIPYEQEMNRQRAIRSIAGEVERLEEAHLREELAQAIDRAGLSKNRDYATQFNACSGYADAFENVLRTAGLLALDMWTDGLRPHQYWLQEDFRRRNGRVALRAFENLAAQPMQIGDIDERISSVQQIRARYLYSNQDVEPRIFLGEPNRDPQTRQWYK